MSPEQPPMMPENPEPKNEELAQIDSEIERVSRELADLFARRDAATDKAARKALEMEISRKLQERAGYQMKKQVLSKGSGQA
jgi:hypothetical protein